MLLSRTNRNFLIAYSLLVGLPLLGLAGVLRTGRHLTAPISIDGQWKLETSMGSLSGACMKSVSLLPDSLMTISQSGKGLVLGFSNGPKLNGSAVLDGTAVNGALSQSDDSGCSLDLLASVDGKSESRAISGSMSVTGCPTCGSVTWNAVRAGRPEKKGSR